MQTQLTSAFDFRVQVLECERCGAPVTGVSGTSTCRHCHATLQLGGRETLIADSLAGAGPMRYLPNPEQDERLRATLGPGHVSLFDILANVPPDLAPLAQAHTVERWKERAAPELRRQWSALTSQARAGALDADAQYRLYWIAGRLSDGLAFLAGDTTGQAAQDLRLRQRAVLETALPPLQPSSPRTNRRAWESSTSPRPRGRSTSRVRPLPR